MLESQMSGHVEVLCSYINRQIRTASRKLNLSARECHPQNTVPVHGGMTCEAYGS
jgi:hypothetical protein